MIINPSILEREQIDVLHAIYNKNEEAISVNCGHEAQYAVENNLLRSIFGEETFSNLTGEESSRSGIKEGYCLQCLHYDRKDGDLYCKKNRMKVSGRKCLCKNYVEW